MSGGTAAGQLIAVCVTPVLSRLYSPTEFGHFAVLIAAVAIAATLGSLRLELAIPAASPADARVLLRVALAAAAVVGLLLVPILIGGGQIDEVLQDGSWLEMGGLSVLVIYLVWSTAAVVIATNYVLRGRTYGVIARRNLLQSTATSAGQVALASPLPSFLGLTVGYGVGTTASLVGLLRRTRRDGVATDSLPRWRDVLWRYRRYPLVFLPAGLMNVFVAQFPLILVGVAYSAADAGNLAQAARLTSIPTVMIGAAVSGVVMAEIARRVRNGVKDNRAQYMKASRALLPLAIGWTLAVIIFAPWVLPALLGADWSTSGLYAAALAPSVGAGVLVSPLSIVTAVYGRSGTQLALDGGRLLVVCLSGGVAWAVGAGPVVAVLAMSLCLTASYAITWGVGYRVVAGRNRRAASGSESARPADSSHATIDVAADRGTADSAPRQ